MKKEEYALLMLDNMPLKGHFVVAKAISHMFSENLEEQLDYTVYEDLVKGDIIYPSSYDANEFIDPEEYEKILKNLKWISRKPLTKDKALKYLKEMEKNDLLSYEINMYTAMEKKAKQYNEELSKHKRVLKKLEYRR